MQQKAPDALKDQLKGKKETLRQISVRLTVAKNKLEKLRLRAVTVKEELSMSQADVSLQTSLREEAQERPDGRGAELEKMQSRLQMLEDVLCTNYDAQTRVAAELIQLKK